WRYRLRSCTTSDNCSEWSDTSTPIAVGAKLTPDASSIDFGSVAVGTTATRTLTITNHGNRPAGVGQQTVTQNGFGGPDAINFRAGRTLAPGDACSIGIAFTPSTAGRTVTRVLLYGATDNPGPPVFGVDLVGRGAVAAPTNVQAVIDGDGHPSMTWDAVDGAEHYEVDRDPAFAADNPSVGAALRYTDADAAPGTTYGYRVRACDDGGCSAYSDAVSVTTPPAAPSGLRAVLQNGHDVAL